MLLQHVHGVFKEQIHRNFSSSHHRYKVICIKAPQHPSCWMSLGFADGCSFARLLFSNLPLYICWLSDPHRSYNWLTLDIRQGNNSPLYLANGHRMKKRALVNTFSDCISAWEMIRIGSFRGVLNLLSLTIGKQNMN